MQAFTPQSATLNAIEEEPRASSYDYRKLFLSGRWKKPGRTEFSFRATIYIQRDGSASGSIYWRAVRIYGAATTYFGTEQVGGFLRGLDVELNGHRTDPGLACDHYRIRLSGPGEAGTFAGSSRTHQANWLGCLEGTFVFRNRRH
jgi:hypothetical protein